MPFLRHFTMNIIYSGLDIIILKMKGWWNTGVVENNFGKSFRV